MSDTHLDFFQIAETQGAIRFYERNGFHPSGKVTGFFGMPLYEYVKLVKHE